MTDDGNRLLGALRPVDLDRIWPRLTRVECERGQVLHHAGEAVRFAWFPCGQSLATFVVSLEPGVVIEAAMVGREGAVGGIVSHGRLPAYADVQVLHRGPFLRIEATVLEEIKLGAPAIANLFTRYADCLVAQMLQSVACNAGHTITQRAAKWLLAAIDRTGNPVVPLRQDQLADMLGVGRSFVNRVLGGFRDGGVLTTRRGSLQINDAEALRALSCTCNDRLREHFDTVLAGVYPDPGEPPRTRS